MLIYSLLLISGKKKLRIRDVTQPFSSFIRGMK